MSSKLAWSFSRIERFRKCQMQSFWMDYAPKHMKVKMPSSPIFDKGNQMHKCMEQSLRQGHPLPAELPVATGDVVDLSSLRPIVGCLQGYEQLWVEEQMAFTKDLRPTGWYDDDVWVRVIWDAAGRRGTRVDMCDWKSGKPRPGSDQLQLFAASVFTRLPDVEEVHTYFVYMEHRKYTHDVFYRSSVDHIWQKFGEEAEQIVLADETGNWEPNPSDFNCKWCPVPKSKCQFSRVEG